MLTDELREQIAELETENIRLKEIITASMASLRAAYKSCHDLFPYEGTAPRFVKGPSEICTYSVYEEARQIHEAQPWSLQSKELKEES